MRLNIKTCIKKEKKKRGVRGEKEQEEKSWEDREEEKCKSEIKAAAAAVSG